MKDEKTIIYSKDIIKNVVAKTGYPSEKVEYVFKFFFWMLKKLMARPDVTTITLPKFCKFYVSLPMLRLKQKELSLMVNITPERMKGIREELAATETRIKFLEEQDLKLQRQEWRGWYKYQVHNMVPGISYKKFTKGKSWLELEEFQNKE